MQFILLDIKKCPKLHENSYNYGQLYLRINTYYDHPFLKIQYKMTASKKSPATIHFLKANEISFQLICILIVVTQIYLSKICQKGY